MRGIGWRTLRGGGLWSRLTRLHEQAQVFAAQHGHASGGEVAPPVPAASLVPPPSAFVKRTSCAFCGAPKQLPSVREYLYCDFCGQLVDVDLRLAAEAAFANPSATEHATQANELGPAAQRALSAGDRERYRQLQRELFELQTVHARWAVPPRAWNDEAYRRRWVTFQTETAVATAFDPAHAELTKRVTRMALGLRWRGGDVLGMAMRSMGGTTEGNPFPTVQATGLWPLVDVLVAQAELGQQIVDREGLRDLDPDRSPPVVAWRLTPSMIAPGWLRHLEPDDGQELVQRLGLRHEYQRPQVSGVPRHCGGCGHELTALPGATCVVCDACGRRIEVGGLEVVCTGCNGHLSLPEGTDRLHCPWCRAEVRRT